MSILFDIWLDLNLFLSRIKAGRSGKCQNLINRNEKGNNEVLRKMDNLLSLLVEHTNLHKDCCLKNILKSIGD